MACYRRSLAIGPTDASAHNGLGRSLKDQGRLEDAAKCYRQAIKHQPEMASAHDNLGYVLRQLGDPVQAADCHQRAVHLNPRSAGIRNNFAVALKNIGLYVEAATEYRQALKLEPGWADIHKNLGNVLHVLGNYREAIEAYAEAHRLDPESQEILFNLAATCAQVGDLESADRHCRTLLKIRPDHATGLALLNEMTNTSEEEDIYTFQALLDSDDASLEERIEAGFGLGRIYDRLGDHERAFNHYGEANRLKRDEVGLNIEEHTLAFRAIRSTFTQEFFEKSDIRGSESDRPIFIVGMPRSGTTLVEQIISSHPQIHGAGELSHIQRITETLSSNKVAPLPFPISITELNQEKAAALADRYLAELQHRNKDAQHVTDKLPSNYRNLGFIALLFPRARIIHCQRHPLDTCLSCYFQRFKEVNYSFDLEHLGWYYSQYAELMAHWREALPIEMLEVRYEDLVENQERVSRELIAYCGLDWDDRCLDFHRNERPVETASMFQVRQPMYADSIGRWKRYDRHIQVLKSVLKPHLD